MSSDRTDAESKVSGNFADFDGYDGETATNVTADHDAWGVDVE